ncbi:uncharacterized protein BYT42DRAFT_581493 [Radiomyces spectabilis]|uniref:uncharacterized protein n=1 Tax=Radiomyces spectabilis TaxID=64574 RepID=UPI00221F4BF8|nr:uncharacterized protein BYT42DRAFT_581493 [Radiomyces spectabilis]KAI8371767.1 hypothetical protein BYT42DRAFT_581493 [Radiomyces spectabilis]
MDDRTSFEIEHQALLEKALQGFEQLVSNLNHFNRNLETVATIGQEFEQPSKLWHDFHTAIKTPQPGAKDNVESS